MEILDYDDYADEDQSPGSGSPRSFSPTPGPADDSSIRADPDQHVDYLSHEWQENDIWSSWRHVTKQKAFLQSGARLENASWRTWAKARNNLKTVSPETLNWLKDCDVTWLYGPLHRGPSFEKRLDSQAAQMDEVRRRRNSLEWPQAKPRLESASSYQVSQNSKPILKKRSNSEMMLARAAFSVRDSTTQTADEAPRPSTQRPIAIRTHSANSALSISGVKKQHFRNNTGPDTTRRRIHFNESVEQCISIVKSDPGDDDYVSCSSDDEDDAPIMRISAPKQPVNIAKLPSTTLKMPSSPPSGNAFVHDDLHDDDRMRGAALISSVVHHERVEDNGASPPGISTRSSRSNSADSTILPNYDGYDYDLVGTSQPSLLGRAADVVTSARELVSVIWSASGWRREPD
ncbi:protein phosphatase regulator [Savitreella phatthalungensis]